MSSGSSDSVPGRDEVLASFQDVTGIEDVEACIRVLENCHWNLQEAIETALVAGTDWHRFGGGTAVESPDDVEVISTRDSHSDAERDKATNPFRALLNRGNNGGEDILMRQPPVEFDDYAAAMGMPRRRMLNFTVIYRGKRYAFSLRDDETIGDLKKYLAKELTSVTGPLEPKDMDLRGWRATGERDDAPLYSLHLPKENTLELLTPNRPSTSTAGASNGSSAKDKSNRQYRLDVYDKENDRTHQLTCDGNKTIGDVKGDVFALTRLPPSRQMWTGWPRGNDEVKECTTLSELDLDTPVHRLRVEPASLSATTSGRSKTETSDDEESVDILGVSDDAMDDSMVLDEHHLSPGPGIERLHQVPLIPADYSSPEEAIENFLRVYEARYGETHPLFYPGSLEDAIRESCHVKATRRKPLLVYLHDDASISANVFSTEVFSKEAVADFLNQNFTVWAWDCTLQENKNKFLLLLSNHLGSTLAYELRQLERDRYPVLLFVHKTRGALEVENMIKAPCSLDELMSQLMHGMDSFARQNQLDVMDEEEREAREKVRSEQEQAYQDSLNMDRMKAEQKRLEQEKLLEEQRHREKQVAQQEKERKLLAEQLPPEPPEDARATTIRLRLPTAEMIERRFLATEKLSTLLKYAASQGYKSDTYRLLTSYPKRDLTSLDGSKTFEELKLCPRETVVVEEK